MLSVEDTNLRFRIERLESLLHYLYGQAVPGASLTSFSGPIVANQAAATALPAATYVTAREVYVLSQEAIWQYIPGVPGAVGVPPLTPGEVIVAAGGVLARTNYSSPKWRIGVNDIFIDPTGGNDENDGFTALTALATGRELFRRWGWGARVEVGPNLVTSPTGFLQIHVLDDILAPDSLGFIILGAANGSMRIIGGVKTVLRTGTLTAAPTPMNRAVPLGGTRLRLTDAALATWTPFIGARGRFTDGPAVGGTFMPQVAVAAGVADCTACQTTSEPSFSLQPITVTPAVGNTYVIEQLIRVNFGPLDQLQNVNEQFGGFDWYTNIIDVEIPSDGVAGASFGTALVPISNNGARYNFYNCVSRRFMDLAQGVNDFVACYFTEAFGTVQPTDSATVSGGGAVRIASTNAPIILYQGLGNFGVIGSDFVSEQFSIGLERDASLGNVGVWNCTVIGAINPGGHGVLIGAIATLNGGGRARLRCLGTLWGAGNAGAGVRVGANCGGSGAPQNITGVAGDFKLGNKFIGWWWNDVTVVYNPIGGFVATTWAAILAGEGAAGFGGNAHELDSDSHWVALEAT